MIAQVRQITLLVVVWSLAALQEVTRLDQSATDTAVRAAQDRIDYLLRRIPRDVGISSIRHP